MRGVAAVVLVGYGMTLGATSAGHGLRLMAHIAEEHHERLEALLFGDVSAEMEDGHAKAHEHTAEAHEHTSEAHEHAAEAPLASGFHSHHGHVHSHHEEPPPPALVTIALDKHCLASRPAVPAPREQRSVEPAAPFEVLAVVVHPVEVRPPRRTA